MIARLPGLQNTIMLDNTDENSLINTSSPLDRRYTFSNYVVGRSNALAHAASMRVSQPQKNIPVEFNPLYIHGPVGTGKDPPIECNSMGVQGKTPREKGFILICCQIHELICGSSKIKRHYQF